MSSDSAQPRQGEVFIITQRWLDAYIDPKTGKQLSSFVVGDEVERRVEHFTGWVFFIGKYRMHIHKDDLHLLDKLEAGE